MLGFISQFEGRLPLAVVRNLKLLWPNFTRCHYPIWILLVETVKDLVCFAQMCKYNQTFNTFLAVMTKLNVKNVNLGKVIC